MKRFVKTVLGLALAAAVGLAVAENATHVPGYIIHHNALTTDTLSPQVAKAYNIQRSKNRGMLNVSVIKEVPGSSGYAVKADIAAHASNLSGQTKAIELREVTDGDAIYYIGDFRVTNQETLNFALDVVPNGSASHYTAKLSQEFFTE
jgi:hypothetical protein